MCSTDSASLISCQSNNSAELWYAYKDMVSDLIPSSLLLAISSGISGFEYHPWVFSLIGSTFIGLSGIFPLLVIPIEEGANIKSEEGGSRTLKVLLSFAVGCLLGDVFLHLLPDIWSREALRLDHGGHPSVDKGLLVLAGLLVFIVLEKMFTFVPEDGEDESAAKNKKKTARKVACSAEVCMLEKRLRKRLSRGARNNNNVDDDVVFACANIADGVCKQIEDIGTVLCAAAAKQPDDEPTIHVSGYLNLLANAFDNFTHGLAVGGSFMVSLPHGALTTFAILLHEIPHEVGDFAILLRSGFSRWDAAKAQVYTAGAGVVGSMTAILLSGASNTVEAKTSWIHPFTAGGFLHIALVTVLPDLLKEENPKDSLMQLMSLLFGIAIMALLGLVVEE
ncbi:zinc transporter ZIP13 homolog [Schistocerca nitens]|uniref:zinc transporter ZIP13 homolog n=1 Tax=Schistocerca cancellata TaxID=274614 RepID=UPI0021173BDA|nr:zinc transporter ZIP13 homolog [Schistocerca cancellata]XP_049810195.1 zinc transporter ZIP13 homolog [Schistocerca nitens]